MTDVPEILIADDSKSNRVSLAAYASALPVDLVIATSGVETVRLAAEHQPAVIVLDVDMADMDGYQVINQLAGDGRTVNIPVVLMETNFASRKAELHGNAIWPTETVYKPINPETFRRKIAALVKLDDYRRTISTIAEFEEGMGATADEGIVGIDAHGRIHYANPGMVKLLRTSYSDLLGTGIESLLEKDYHATESNWHEHTVAEALKNGKTVQVKKAVLWSHAGNRITTTFIAVPVEAHPTLSGLLVFKNISHRAKADTETVTLAGSDPLTGLANRFKFEEVLSGLIKLYQAKTNVLISRKRSAPCAVLSVGLDHFSHINKGLGHNVGDKLLQGVAHRLRNCISDLDLVARLGGDEFVIALTHMFDASEATTIAQGIQQSLDEPFLIDGNEIFSSASIGVATYPECGDTSQELLTNSSLAMQSAKTAGRHGIQFYTDSLNQNYLYKVELEGEIRQALANDSLQIEYRPLYDAIEATEIGHEAVVTWTHPEQGTINANRLLADVDQPQILSKLTYRTLLEACNSYAAWRSATGNTEHLLIVPFPAFHMMLQSFYPTLHSVLAQSRLDPRYLLLEIVESKVDVNFMEFSEMLNKIASLGVNLALNVFSGPRTPLTHLMQFNLHTIRIDHHLIEDILNNPKGTIFVKSVISMAHDLGIRVIADGVETERQANFLRSLGCDALQGSYYPALTPIDLIRPAASST